eukprot:2004627-Pyramimonas_sp.AAC.1
MQTSLGFGHYSAQGLHSRESCSAPPAPAHGPHATAPNGRVPNPSVRLGFEPVCVGFPVRSPGFRASAPVRPK